MLVDVFLCFSPNFPAFSSQHPPSKALEAPTVILCDSPSSTSSSGPGCEQPSLESLGMAWAQNSFMRHRRGRVAPGLVGPLRSRHVAYALLRRLEALAHGAPRAMSALFDFQGLLVVVLLSVCTCSYLRRGRQVLVGLESGSKGRALGTSYSPRQGAVAFQRRTVQAPGFLGMFGRFAVIGDRLSPFVAGACVIMACPGVIL